MTSKFLLIKKYLKKNNANNEAKLCELNLCEMLWSEYITRKEREKLSFFKYTNIMPEKISSYKESFRVKSKMIENISFFNELKREDLNADIIEFFKLLKALNIRNNK